MDFVFIFVQPDIYTEWADVAELGKSNLLEQIL